MSHKKKKSQQTRAQHTTSVSLTYIVGAMSQDGDSFPPAIPSVFVIKTSSSLVNAGSFSHQLYQRAESFNFQALLPYTSEE